MTTTPHACKEEDVQLFLALLDPDRFAGRFRKGVHALDTADAHPAAYYLSLCCPCPYKTLGFTPDDNSTGLQTWGQGANGSTFGLTTIDGTTYVTADGPLWDALETAYAQWRALGQPDRDRFGVTTTQARQWVWLDHPDHVITELSEP
ncbi:MAG: hypothetical protein ACRDRN_25090 [Sciscionella sp.]